MTPDGKQEATTAAGAGAMIRRWLLVLLALPPLLAAAAGLLALGWWAGHSGAVTVTPRVPGTDRPAGAVVAVAGPDLARGELRAGPGTPADLPGAWPGFRGPNGDGISPAPDKLADRWPAAGPRIVWGIDVGEGHAGAAVRDGRVYVLDYDRIGQRDVVRCLSLADGQDLWRYAYRVQIKRNHGMSRTVPAVTSNSVVTLGPKCHVVCLDSRTGAFRWGLDLVRDHGAIVPPWYAGQCPLIDGDRVILAPGGSALLMAVELATGRVIWQTPNPQGWKMTHASVAPVVIDGVQMYVYPASGGVVGVAAADGALLWSTTDWKIAIATVPTPVPVGEGRLFFAGGYNAGCLMLTVRREGGRFAAAPAWRLPATVFGADQQTPVYYQGYLYGVRPGGELTCLDLDGKVRWSSGPTQRFALGPFVAADGKLYVLEDRGRLAMVRATPERCDILGQAAVLTGHDAWGPLAVAGTRLIARDLTRMVCLDLGEEKKAGDAR